MSTTDADVIPHTDVALAQQVAALEARLATFEVIQHKQLAEALRESEARFRLALANSPIMVYTTDRELRYTWVYNPVMGFTAEQLLGKRDDELLSAEDAAALIALKQQVLDQGVGLRRQLALQVNGQTGYYDVTAEPWRDPAGQTLGLTVAVTEMTEQVRLRQEREEVYAVLEALFASAPVGLAWVDQELRFVQVNDAFAAINGLSPAAHVGQTPPELVPDLQDLGAILATWRRILQSGEPVVGVEVTGSTPAAPDVLRYWEETWYPIRLRDTNIGIGIVAEDITARKQAAEALRTFTATLEVRVRERTREVQALAAELALAEQAERQRIARILHDDIQQYLYAIHMQLHLLEQDSAQDSAQAHSGAAVVADVVADHLATLNDLVSNTLQATRTLAVELSPPVLARAGLPAAAHWLAGHMQGVHGLGVIVASEGDCHMADTGRRTLLFQILRELLFNVVKHAGVKHAAVQLRGNEQAVTMVVSDTGQGFATDALPSSPNAPTGYGLLGLRERVRLFGGEIEIAAAPGQGTQVTVVLPLFDAFT